MAAYFRISCSTRPVSPFHGVSSHSRRRAADGECDRRRVEREASVRRAAEGKSVYCLQLVKVKMRGSARRRAPDRGRTRAPAHTATRRSSTGRARASGFRAPRQRRTRVPRGACIAARLVTDSRSLCRCGLPPVAPAVRACHLTACAESFSTKASVIDAPRRVQ